MMVVMTSWAPVLAFRMPGMAPPIAPPRQPETTLALPKAPRNSALYALYTTWPKTLRVPPGSVNRYGQLSRAVWSVPMMISAPMTSAVMMARLGTDSAWRMEPALPPATRSPAASGAPVASAAGACVGSASASGSPSSGSPGLAPRCLISATGRLLRRFLERDPGHEQAEVLSGGLAGGDDGHDLAPRHHRDAVGQRHHLVQLRGNDEHR